MDDIHNFISVFLSFQLIIEAKNILAGEHWNLAKDIKKDLCLLYENETSTTVI